MARTMAIICHWNSTTIENVEMMSKVQVQELQKTNVGIRHNHGLKSLPNPLRLIKAKAKSQHLSSG